MARTAAEILGPAAIPELLERIHPVRPEEVRVVPAPGPMRRFWNRGTGAMTLGNAIFVRPNVLAAGGPRLRDLIVHELVHVRQWRSGATGFLARYLHQYLMARLFGARHHLAYRSIGAEVEARQITGGVRRLLDNHPV
jgi:hypothetical protein